MGDLSAHFSRREFACPCGCGFATVDVELLYVLEGIRDYFGEPVKITSGCRCFVHNMNIGGSENSMHMHGRAADITVRDVSPEGVQTYLENQYPGKYGIGRYKGWTHIDSREGPGRWDKR